MAVDEAFKGAGQKPGIEIWRIKQFKCLPIPKSEYGQFYQGDSYIILVTYEVQKKLVHDAHYWLGKDASQDEYGTAAIKTVELDDSLGGLPVQHREVQDHESPLFLSYFKSGIKYLLGGYESGFNHVGDEEYKPRLFQCKGKRNVRVRQVPMSVESLNRGDVFILDSDEHIYVWMPPKAGRLERIKGVHHATSIRDNERAGRGEIVVCDSDWDSNDGFWSGMGGSAEEVPEGDAASDDRADALVLAEEAPPVTLHKITDDSGRMRVEKAGERQLDFALLDSKDAFILDSASGGLFVWVGKNCSLAERSKAMEYASEYLRQEGRPPWSQKQFKPKLFQCSDETGEVNIEEIANFDQEDLDGEDVMILDTLDKVYVWVGSGANEAECIHANEIAQKYLRSDAMPRPPNAEGSEPSDFTKHFKRWNPDANAFAGRTVENMLRK